MTALCHGDTGSVEPSPDTAPVSDDELITCWGLMHEAIGATDHLVLADVDPESPGLAGPWFEVLIRLLRTPDHRLPMNRLAREVSLTSGGFTKLADRLERRGYLERVPCTFDRRTVYATLTVAGLALARECLERHVRLLRRHLLGPLGADGVRELSDRARLLRDHSRAAIDGP